MFRLSRFLRNLLATAAPQNAENGKPNEKAQQNDAHGTAQNPRNADDPEPRVSEGRAEKIRRGGRDGERAQRRRLPHGTAPIAAPGRGEHQREKRERERDLDGAAPGNARPRQNRSRRDDRAEVHASPKIPPPRRGNAQPSTFRICPSRASTLSASLSCTSARFRLCSLCRVLKYTSPAR